MTCFTFTGCLLTVSKLAATCAGLPEDLPPESTVTRSRLPVEETPTSTPLSEVSWIELPAVLPDQRSEFKSKSSTSALHSYWAGMLLSTKKS